MDQKFIIFSADALVNEDLELLSTMPNFRRYLAGGCRTEYMYSIYPTITYPCHNSMSTGNYPDKHGIVHNFQDLPPIIEDVPGPIPWVLDHKYVKCPDILDAAKRAGLSTAAVYWPVTGNHKSVDYLINEYPGCAPDVPLEGAFREMGSSEEMIEIVSMYKKQMNKSGHHPYTDYFVCDCGAEIIRRHAPDLILLHPANVDGYRHQSGVFSEKVNDSIRETDDMIGLICRAYEQAGYKGKFNFILVSDHGQLDVSRSVNVNTFFADKGWYTLDENGKAIDWKVTAISCGFSAYVKVKDPTDEAFKKEVKAYLQHLADEGIYGFGQVFDEYELEEQWHLKGDFQFMLETDGCTSFWDRYTHPFVDNKKDFSDYRKGNATHGFLPTKGPRPVFVAKGPAFKENYVGRGGCIVDIAPTVAKAMGIEFYPCDGEARVDLLK